MKPELSSCEKARRYLAVAHDFRLGLLPTEQPHPRTVRLSELARTDITRAISVLKHVELDALRTVVARLDAIEQMAHDVARTLDAGHRIFLCGCGATGRLSLTLESLWRERLSSADEATARASYDPGQVVSFMAGGDYALVCSVETFEDHPDYGARQLEELEFSQDDLFIGCTEGGETPFVIGATEAAARTAIRTPYFLHCNPDEVLTAHVERSRRVLENPRIRTINLCVGPMAVCGSTRLQATTVLTLAVGCALLRPLGSGSAHEVLESLVRALDSAPIERLAPFIEAEAEAYRHGHRLVHCSRAYAITVLTDLTERSPTFSLQPFENRTEPQGPLAWTYLWLPDAAGAKASWQHVLRRSPRALSWPELGDRYGLRALYGFDFGQSALSFRQAREPLKEHFVFEIDRDEEIVLAFRGLALRLPRPRELLVEHLLVKVLMNISSTLVMGRLGRYQGNLMIWVRASNLKLVDRSIRFAQILLEEQGIRHASYDSIAHHLFAALESLGPDEPVVLKIVDRIVRSHSQGALVDRVGHEVTNGVDAR